MNRPLEYTHLKCISIILKGKMTYNSWTCSFNKKMSIKQLCLSVCKRVLEWQGKESYLCDYRSMGELHLDVRGGMKWSGEVIFYNYYIDT